jgi:hypothetical protein
MTKIKHFTTVTVGTITPNSFGDEKYTADKGELECRFSLAEYPLRLSDERVVQVSAELLSSNCNVILATGNFVAKQNVIYRVETIQTTHTVKGEFNHQFATLSESYTEILK